MDELRPDDSQAGAGQAATGGAPQAPGPAANVIPPKMGFFAKLVNIFVEPSAVFKNVYYYNDWLTPFVLFAAVLILMTVLQTVYYADQAQEIKSQILAVMPSGGSQGISGSMSSPIVACVSAVLTTAIVWLFVALIIFALGSFLLEKVNFAKTFSVVAFSHLPVIFSIVISSINKLNSTVNIKSWEDFIDFMTPWTISLARILPEGTVLYRFMSNIDIFRLWSLWLLALGLALAFKSKMKRVWAVVVIYAVLFAVSKLGGVLYYSYLIPYFLSKAPK